MKTGMEIAVYGKGGIGKSTISANLSAALAQRGKRVLQIGCDPKHDSTRLLLHGEEPVAVLDYLRTQEEIPRDPSCVLRAGYLGVGCVEAGGPQPGIGCAGRGIISAFEFLKSSHCKEDYDIVIYDVLGDVVCGGFAVPVRREYADVIFLVTSGEFMSLYAANNILRGIRNFDGDRYRRVAGIIYNERLLPQEDARLARFAQAVGLPVLAKVPRSHAFAQAEEARMPLMEMEGCGELKAVFLRLADEVTGGAALYTADPLTDAQLEEVVTGREVSVRAGLLHSAPEGTIVSAGVPDIASAGPGDFTPDDSEELSRVLSGGDASNLSGSAKKEHAPHASFPPAMQPSAARKTLYGCAFNGAATTAVHLTDAYVLAHGPRACAFYTLQNITSSGRKNLFNRGILMPSACHPNFESTDMRRAEAVFGGMELLAEKVHAAIAAKPGCVVVISTCTSGITGDDISRMEELGTDDVPVISIAADGVGAGDYMEGIRLCMHALSARLIDPSVTPVGRRVNLINETGVSNNIAVNYRVIEDMLRQMDIEVNCRFLGETETGRLKNFLRAPLNLLATNSEDSIALKDYLQETYGCKFLDAPFPIGFEAAAAWARELGAFFHASRQAEEMIRREEERYHSEIAALKEKLSGKRLLLTTINAGLDWLLTAAAEAGMHICWIGVMNYLQTKLCVTAHPELCDEIAPEFTPELLQEKIRDCAPDLIVTNYTQMIAQGDYLVDAIPMMPAAGFHSALQALARWAELFERREEAGWENDRALFERYYS